MAETEFTEAQRAEAYEEARRLIAEAAESGADFLSLDRNATNALTVLPPEIADLGKLKTLDLDNTQVSDLRGLEGLSGLQVLHLNNTRVRDLRGLEGLSGLQVLRLNNTQVRDLRALEGLIGLRQLWLSNTQVRDLRALEGLIGLRQLWLSNTQVRDLRALEGLSELHELWLNNTQVSDLRVVLTLPRIREAAEKRDIPYGVFFKGALVAKTDPELHRISEMGNDKDRTLALLDYLETLPPLEPELTEADLPEQGPGLAVSVVEGRLDVAAGDLTPEELADRQRRKLHERLKQSTANLERRAGNQFYVLAGKARALIGALECDFEALDVTDVYMELEVLRIDAARDNAGREEPYDTEVLNALDEVLNFGGGLIYGTEEVDRLEGRKDELRGVVRDAVEDAVAGVAARMLDTVDLLGDRLKAYLALASGTEDDGARRFPTVLYDLVRNTLIASGRWMLLAAAGGIVGSSAWVAVQWIGANPEVLMRFAEAMGVAEGSWLMRQVEWAISLLGKGSGVPVPPVKPF